MPSSAANLSDHPRNPAADAGLNSLYGWQSPYGFLIGVALSVVLHAGLWLYFGYIHRLDLRPEALQEQTEDYFEVGLFVKPEPQPKQDTPVATDEPDAPQSNQPASPFAANNSNTPSRQEVPDTPPIQPSLPGKTEKTIGPGPATSAPAFGGGNRPFVAPSGVKDDTPSLPPKRGTNRAEFFNIGDTGKRIVYAVDRSGSMIHNDALLVAKRELIASLNGLSPKQEFQVIFYDESAYALTPKPGSRQTMLAATSRNVEKIKLRISGIRPKGGTRHIAALQAALKQRPDVIFFLTDANSSLDARELNTVRRLNQSNTRIHCIEFGKGPDLSGEDNFLKRLARMTGGKYRYRNVQEFTKRRR